MYGVSIYVTVRGGRGGRDGRGGHGGGGGRGGRGGRGGEGLSGSEVTRSILECPEYINPIVNFNHEPTYD